MVDISTVSDGLIEGTVRNWRAGNPFASDLLVAGEVADNLSSRYGLDWTTVHARILNRL